MNKEFFLYRDMLSSITEQKKEWENKRNSTFNGRMTQIKEDHKCFFPPKNFKR